MSLARAIGRNTIFTAIGRSSVLLVWFFVTPGVLDSLGPERFGFWSVLLLATGTLATFDLGLGVAVMRFVGELVGRGSAGAVRQLVARALGFPLVLACALAGAALLLRGVILGVFRVPEIWAPEAFSALTLALVAFVLIISTNLLIAALQGLQRMDLAAIALVISALFLAVAVPIASRQARPLYALVLAQTGYGIVLLLALTVCLGLALRGAGAQPGVLVHVTLGRIVSLGGWIQGISLLLLIQQNLDKVLLGILVALAPVGAYEIAFRVTSVGLLPPVYFLGALLPVVARRQVEAGDAARVALYRAGIPFSFSTSLGLAGGLFALAPSLLEAWLGTPPAGSVFMLRCLVVAGVANLLTGVASTIVRAADRMDIELAYVGSLVLLHLVLSLIGFRFLGWSGILYGLVAASTGTALVFVIRVERWLGLHPLSESARAAVPGFVAAVVAGLAAAAVGFAFQGLAPGRVRGLVTAGTGAIAFGVVFGGVFAVAFPSMFRGITQRARMVFSP